MKFNKFIIFSSFLFSLMSVALIANDKLDALKEESKQKSKDIVSTNIQYIKEMTENKIKEAQLKLEQYEKELKNCENNDEVQACLKKIHKMEKKIKNLKDSLAGILFAENKASE